MSTAAKFVTPPIYKHPLTMDGRDPKNLRGDKITGERYTSKEFAQREWDHMWTRIWHVAGRVQELQEPGEGTLGSGSVAGPAE